MAEARSGWSCTRSTRTGAFLGSDSMTPRSGLACFECRHLSSRRCATPGQIGEGNALEGHRADDRHVPLSRLEQSTFAKVGQRASYNLAHRADAVGKILVRDLALEQPIRHLDPTRAIQKV